MTDKLDMQSPNWANKNTQFITFNSLPVKVMGDAPFTVSATYSVGLPVIFSAVTDNITVNENIITITAPGQATLQAMQILVINLNNFV